MTGEEKEIFIRHKRHDNNKFPKKKIRDYRSPVVKNPILVEKYAKESSQKRDNLHKKKQKEDINKLVKHIEKNLGQNII